MTTQETKIVGDRLHFEKRIAVTESYRVTIQVKYHGPTTHRGSRITVSRWDSPTQGVDPQRITLKWDDSCSTGENYAQAVREYCIRAEWQGHWRIGSTPTGAVAVWVGYLDEVQVSE
jgi:hypothetical protein